MSVTGKLVAKEFSRHFGNVRSLNVIPAMLFRELQLSLKGFLEARPFLVRFKGDNDMAFDDADVVALFTHVARKIWKSPWLLVDARKSDLVMLCVKEIYNLQQVKAAKAMTMKRGGGAGEKTNGRNEAESTWSKEEEATADDDDDHDEEEEENNATDDDAALLDKEEEEEEVTSDTYDAENNADEDAKLDKEEEEEVISETDDEGNNAVADDDDAELDKKIIDNEEEEEEETTATTPTTALVLDCDGAFVDCQVPGRRQGMKYLEETEASDDGWLEHYLTRRDVFQRTRR
jgi:hypothetical protein